MSKMCAAVVFTLCNTFYPTCFLVCLLFHGNNAMLFYLKTKRYPVNLKRVSTRNKSVCTPISWPWPPLLFNTQALYSCADSPCKTAPDTFNINFNVDSFPSSHISDHKGDRLSFLQLFFVTHNTQSNCQCVSSQFIASKMQETHSAIDSLNYLFPVNILTP